MFHESIHHVAETSLHFMQKTSWLMFSAGLSWQVVFIVPQMLNICIGRRVATILTTHNSEVQVLGVQKNILHWSMIIVLHCIGFHPQQYYILCSSFEEWNIEIQFLCQFLITCCTDVLLTQYSFAGIEMPRQSFKGCIFQKFYLPTLKIIQ